MMRFKKNANFDTQAAPSVLGLALTLATFVLVVVVAFLNSWNHFFYFFQKFPKFRFRG